MSRPEFEAGDKVWYDGTDAAVCAVASWGTVVNPDDGDEEGQRCVLVELPIVIDGIPFKNPANQSVLESALHREEQTNGVV